MTKILNEIINVFIWSSIKLTSFWPSRLNIFVMRKLNQIQLNTDQLKAISMVVKRQAPCKLLIFGLGNDSIFWTNLNRGGVTIFLEDDKDWYQRVTKKSKDLVAFLVNYNTKRNDWKMLLESLTLLQMTLPDNIENEKWDIIFVDAPAGWNDQTPGRMKSIVLASRLVKNSGHVFVHDCDREVEDIYCHIFLKKENLETEIKSASGYLRHYHVGGIN